MWVFLLELAHDGAGEAERGTFGESFAPRAESAFTAEVYASGVPLVGKDGLGMHSFGTTRLGIGRQVCPEFSAFSCQPPIEAVASIGDSLVVVVFASTRRGAKDAFGKHLLFAPSLNRVAPACVGEGFGQTA